jgi:hypothetical protein
LKLLFQGLFARAKISIKLWLNVSRSVSKY